MVDAMFTIAPPWPASIIALSSYFMARKTPRTFTDIIRSKSSSAQSASGTIGVLLAPIGVISMLVIGLTWWWVNRTISKPLIKLNSRARQVMAGADLRKSIERAGGLSIEFQQGCFGTGLVIRLQGVGGCSCG